MTTIQIIQLILVFGQCIAEELCGVAHLFYIGIIQIIILLTFFGNFYYQNYLNKMRRVKKE